MSTGAREPLTEIAAAGDWGTVEYVIRTNGQVPARQFLDEELELLRQKGRTAAAKFLGLFDAMANTGSVPGFKPEMEGFFAFRAEFRNKRFGFRAFRMGEGDGL